MFWALPQTAFSNRKMCASTERRRSRFLVLVAKRRQAIAWDASPHLYPEVLTLLPSPLFRGEGLGVRGFALCFDWIFDRAFHALLVSQF